MAGNYLVWDLGEFEVLPKTQIRPNIATSGIAPNRYLKSEAMVVGKKDAYIRVVARAIRKPMDLICVLYLDVLPAAIRHIISPSQNICL
jgi:hypothetical protein